MIINKMNPEIKQLWISALRSGDYEQGRDNLRSGDYEQGRDNLRSFRNTYCCLGVLCELAVEAGAAEHGTYSGYSSPGEGDDLTNTALPDSVVAWAGLPSEDGGLVTPIQSRKSGVTRYSLIWLNDVELYTFDQIADVIEEQF